MRRLILFTLSFFLLQSVSAQRIAEYTYWFYFSDKDENGYSIYEPERFLSQKSIDRRAWQSLPIDHSDLPITHAYIDSLSSLGLEILYSSRWLNGALIRSTDLAMIDTLSNLSFLDTLQWEAKSDDVYFPEIESGMRFSNPYTSSPDYQYGYAYDQINQLKLDFLHQQGYSGKGVTIAVLDAGFINLTDLPVFQAALNNNLILATKNFVSKGTDIYNGHSHGTSVTSIIAANWPDSLMGGAPDVNLILALTENPASETRVEEYSWIEAAEWADSLGADILNTSLGYTTFDDSTTNFSYEDMDGKTAHISIANGMTAAKGLISVTSAGNSGNDPWHYIGAPADATDILAVGSVNADGQIAAFSSHGPSFDHRIKPELSAMGTLTSVQTTDGSIRQGSGTSFAAPMIAGATATLWQAYPTLSAKELMRRIIESGDRYLYPDINYGYGIPNFKSTFYAITSMEIKTYSDEMRVYPNPFTSFVNIDLSLNHEYRFKTTLYDIKGRVVYSDNISLPGRVELPENLHPGIYLIEISNNNHTYRSRLIKY